MCSSNVRALGSALDCVVRLLWCSTVLLQYKFRSLSPVVHLCRTVFAERILIESTAVVFQQNHKTIINYYTLFG